MGLCIIGVNLYIRLFNSKQEHSLIIFKDNLFFKISFMIFIIFHIITIILSIYSLYKRFYNKNNDNSYVIKTIQKLINICYWKPLEYIHDLIAPNLPYSAQIILYITNKIENNKFFGFIAKFSYMIFGIFPRILVSFIFIYDIIILNKICYFPYAIILLLIPIIYKVYLKLTDSLIKRNWFKFAQFLDVTPVGEPNSYGVYLDYAFKLKEEYEDNYEILKENADYWMLFFRLSNYLSYIRKHDNNLLPYVNIFCSSMYLIAGSYRLWYILIF